MATDTDYPALELRVLGELEVRRNGAVVSLPPSRKTRSLLAYLALTQKSHRRERLCEFLWDVADDPRGALRWSLSKLRSSVNDGECKRIVANRQEVRFELEGGVIDLDEVRRAHDRLADASIEELEQAAELFRGELLEGCDMHDFDEFQTWLVGMREDCTALRVGIAQALISRLAGQPEKMLPHARVLVHANPVNEAAQRQLVDLLGKVGRVAEAEQQLESAKRSFEELTGSIPEGLLGARVEVGVAKQAPVKKSAPAPSPVPRSPLMRTTIHGLRMVGREREIVEMRATLDAVQNTGSQRAITIGGEPGVGKSRMLVTLMIEARMRRAMILEATAYEAERSRPYGPWVDAFRRLGASGKVDTSEVLGPLLSSADADPLQRDRLYARALGVLTATESKFTLIALDDLQWFDEPSIELLHYVIRMTRRHPVCIALAARGGELADNGPALRLVRKLRREPEVLERELGPMSPKAIEELVSQISRRVNPEEVYLESGGNPLFALEVVRSQPRTGIVTLSSLTNTVRDRLEHLPSSAFNVLRWASVLGPVFRIDTLVGLVRIELDELGEALEDLENHTLIAGVVDADDPGATYQFSHQLVHRIVYSDLSVPRKRLMHAQVVKVLKERNDDSGDQATELAHHAVEAGDASSAAKALLLAAKRCLHLAAPTQAVSLARRGLRQAERMRRPEGFEVSEALEAIVQAAEAQSASV